MNEPWDVVIVGSGFGGAMSAHRLAAAGLRVLVLERGSWVDRDDTAWNTQAILIDRKYRAPTPFAVDDDAGRRDLHPDAVVGGNSVFYGAASFRLRETDFAMARTFGADAGDGTSWVDWPIGYRQLAPFYDRAERLLGVVGVAGADPGEPARDAPYVGPPPLYSGPARRLAAAARSLGLRPFPIPLAINFGAIAVRNRCVQCLTCDQFPCKVGAKNDLAVAVLPAAMECGAVVRTGTLATRLRTGDGRVTEVECIEESTGRAFVARCRVCIVSAGAIASAGLLLRSGFQHTTPGGRWIGRALQRHCNSIVAGLCPSETNRERLFHKQVAITDHYYGDPSGRGPRGPWGTMQGLQVPPPELIKAYGPFPANLVGARTVRHHLYLLCLGHDRPSRANRVELDPGRRDAHGLPLLRVVHRYVQADRDACAALRREAGRILRRAGAAIVLHKDIDTYSHAVGTCRFGTGPHVAALDPWCRVFGVRNLYVVDGSFMPTCGAVNPSLTIAANALRVADHIASAGVAGEWSDPWTG